MKENDFKPAKIISRPDDKRKEQSDSTVSPSATGPEPTALVAAPSPGPSAQPENDRVSWNGILKQFTGKDESTVVYARPYDMLQHGVFNGLYGSTVDKVARDIQGIVIATIFHAYLLIGYYLLAVFFDNDESKAFSKNPYKETSLNDLAKRDDIPFTRQKLTDCIKAAAVDMELNKYA